MAYADYSSVAQAAAEKYGVPFSLFRSVIDTESQWNPFAVSSAGAYGLGQLLPSTAQGLGRNIYDPTDNLNGSAQYLAQLKGQFGNWTDAVGAYNAGPGKWQKVLAGTAQEPAETSAYVAKVFSGATGYGYTGGPAAAIPSGGGATSYNVDGRTVAGNDPNADAIGSSPTLSDFISTFARSIGSANFGKLTGGAGYTADGTDKSIPEAARQPGEQYDKNSLAGFLNGDLSQIGGAIVVVVIIGGLLWYGVRKTVASAA